MKAREPHAIDKCDLFYLHLRYLFFSSFSFSCISDCTKSSIVYNFLAFPKHIVIHVEGKKKQTNKQKRRWTTGQAPSSLQLDLHIKSECDTTNAYKSGLMSTPNSYTWSQRSYRLPLYLFGRAWRTLVTSFKPAS